jgi:acetoin utilization protein AcuB
MIVRNRMKSPVITIEADRPLDAARALLQRHKIRQLPVVAKNRLIGIITDRDLRATHPEGTTVNDVMTRDPLTVNPMASVDEAARVLRTRKIGALPVLEGTKLVGILSASDVLDAFVDLTGVGQPTYRLIVAGAKGKQAEQRVRQIIEDAHGEIRWIQPDSKESSRVHVRLKAKRIEDVVIGLEAAGFDVPSVVAPSPSRA